MHYIVACEEAYYQRPQVPCIDRYIYTLGIDDCKYAHLMHDVNMLHTEAMMPNFAIICWYM